MKEKRDFVPLRCATHEVEYCKLLDRALSLGFASAAV